MRNIQQLQNISWDFRDQMYMSQRQKVNNEDIDGIQCHGEKTYYMYDDKGRRVRKATLLANGNLKDERIYLDDLEIYRKHSRPHANLLRETIHINGDKQRIAIVETRNEVNDGSMKKLIRYQFDDHLGSSTLELNDKAKIISYEEYTPYGSSSYQAVRNQNETPKRYRYSGKEKDEESGLYYYGERYYESSLAKWCSPDPSGISDGINSTVFTQNRPISAIDKQGDKITLIGYTYVIEGTLNGQKVKYAGSAKLLQSRHTSDHKWWELIKKKSTKITAKPVYGELDKPRSNRRTTQSARGEALRSAEQKVLDKERKKVARENRQLKPGQKKTKILNVDEAAQKPDVWAKRHKVSTGRSITIKKAGSAFKASGLGALSIIDIVRTVREMQKAQYFWEVAMFQDEEGTFLLGKEFEWLVVPHYYKHYIVGENEEGYPEYRTVEITREEYKAMIKEMETVWGYLDWKGDFVPGIFRKELPEVPTYFDLETGSIKKLPSA
jgi:RHS repeat-associated protein